MQPEHHMLLWVRVSYLLFLRGYGRSEPPLAQRLAKAMELPEPDARLCLASRFPRTLLAFSDPDQAVEALARLQGQQFEGFVASSEEIEAPPALAVAGRAELSEDKAAWWHAAREAAASTDLGIVQDRVITQNREHVRALFRASVRWFARTDTRVTRSSDLGKIQVSETRPGGVTTEADREQMLLVKGSGHDAFVVVRERSFNFSCLGIERTYGPGANIGRLVARLRLIFPAAFYDETLLQFTGEMGLEFRSASSARTAPAIRESSETEHNSNFASVIRMARLLSMQQGLG